MVGQPLSINTGNARFWRAGEQIITRQPPSDPHVAKHPGAVVISMSIGHPDQQVCTAHAEWVLNKFINIFFPFNMFGQCCFAVARQCLKCRPQQVSTKATCKGIEGYSNGFMYRPVFAVCLVISHLVFLFLLEKKHVITAMRWQAMSGGQA